MRTQPTQRAAGPQLSNQERIRQLQEENARLLTFRDSVLAQPNAVGELGW